MVEHSLDPHFYLNEGSGSFFNSTASFKGFKEKLPDPSLKWMVNIYWNSSRYAALFSLLHFGQ